LKNRSSLARLNGGILEQEKKTRPRRATECTRCPKKLGNARRCAIHKLINSPNWRVLNELQGRELALGATRFSQHAVLHIYMQSIDQYAVLNRDCNPPPPPSPTLCVSKRAIQLEIFLRRDPYMRTCPVLFAIRMIYGHSCPLHRLDANNHPRCLVTVFISSCTYLVLFNVSCSYSRHNSFGSRSSKCSYSPAPPAHRDSHFAPCSTTQTPHTRWAPGLP
jgi:hypothetical protein